jgi:hypothetical protein
MDREAKTIDVLLEEYRQCAAESLEYSRLQFQLFTVFFAFLGVTIVFATAGQPWMWLLLLFIIPVFLIGAVSLDENQMMNSVHLHQNERVLNAILDQEVMTWQRTVGYAQMRDVDGRKVRFHQPVLMLIIIFLIFFAFSAYFVGKHPLFDRMILSMSSKSAIGIAVRLRHLYTFGCFVGYVLLSYILVRQRRQAIKQIEQISSAEQRRMKEFRRLVARSRRQNRGLGEDE